MKARRHDSDNGVGLMADHYRLTDDIGRRRERRDPEFVAQDDDAMSGLVFFRGEGAAEHRSDSQGGKQIGGDASAADHLCVFAIGFAEEARLIVVGSE